MGWCRRLDITGEQVRVNQMDVRPAYARIDHLDAYMPREDWAKLPGSDVQLRVAVKLMRLRICDPDAAADLRSRERGCAQLANIGQTVGIRSASLSKHLPRHWCWLTALSQQCLKPGTLVFTSLGMGDRGYVENTHRGGH